MFDQFKNLQGLAGLMKNAGQIREQAEKLREEMKHVRVSAETGAGAVHATASGDMRIVSVRVDPAMLAVLTDGASTDENRTLAEDLIVGAVNAALEKAQKVAAEEIQKRAREMGISLPPGLDLGKMLQG